MKILLDNLELNVALGVSEMEKAKKQRIRVYIELSFSDSSSFITDDSSENYFCYAKIVRAVKQYCEEGRFNLIEYLCYQIHRVVKEYVGATVKVKVILHKPHIGIKNVKGGAVCEYEK